MSYATKEQLAELAAYMASQINVPTIGIGGGYAPIGTIISYMGTTAPQDYLACDGSTKNIADYPQLADFFEAQFGSKNYFGGDGTTTFAVPDLQGEFLRGTGTNTHTNQGSGGNVGEHQDGTQHNFVAPYQVSATSMQVVIEVDANLGNSKLQSDGVNSDYLLPSSNKTTRRWTNGQIAANSASNSNPTIRYASRPTNTSVLYCIKAVVAGDVYSTDERVVGTWIDGKPIYQKTFVRDQTASIAANTARFEQYDVSDLDIDSYVGISGGDVFDSDFFPFGMSGVTAQHIPVIAHNVQVSSKSLISIEYFTTAVCTLTHTHLTVQYTKTTD